MAVLPQATPLLLTKRLNAFLSANQTPELPTLLLTTYHGKLLAHSSTQPVSVLRTHATVAASLLAIHTSSSVALPSALPGFETPDLGNSAPPSVRSTDDDTHTEEDDDEETARGTDDEVEQQQYGRQTMVGDAGPSEHRQQHQHGGSGGVHSSNSVKPVTITVQLSGGTVIIRRLKCGLLFVCIGPSTHESPSTTSSTAGGGGPTTAAGAGAGVMSSSLGGGSSGGTAAGGGGLAAVTQALENTDLLNATTSTVSETESLISAGGQTTTSMDSSASTSIVAMRRHAADLARWLDDKLGTLAVPEDSTGTE